MMTRVKGARSAILFTRGGNFARNFSPVGWCEFGGRDAGPSVHHEVRRNYQIAMRTALEEICAGERTHEEARAERGWKLFIRLPRMLLHRPARGGPTPPIRPTLANPILANPFLASPFGQPIMANPFLAKIRG